MIRQQTVLGTRACRLMQDTSDPKRDYNLASNHLYLKIEFQIICILH